MELEGEEGGGDYEQFGEPEEGGDIGGGTIEEGDMAEAEEEEPSSREIRDRAQVLHFVIVCCSSSVCHQTQDDFKTGGKDVVSRDDPTHSGFVPQKPA